MWILGGVCRETKDVFLKQCDNNLRDRATLEHIIANHVEKGSRILTDGWAAYTHLNKLGYTWDIHGIGSIIGRMIQPGQNI